MARNTISECEFEKICREVGNESDIIYKHNPIGSKEETILWMIMSILVSYLSLSEQEIPCFPGRPNAETYRQAISQILNDRKFEPFDETEYLTFLEN